MKFQIIQRLLKLYPQLKSAGL